MWLPSRPGVEAWPGLIFMDLKSNGCFYKLGVLFVAVCLIRAVLFGVYIRAPDFWNLPSHTYKNSLDPDVVQVLRFESTSHGSNSAVAASLSKRADALSCLAPNSGPSSRVLLMKLLSKDFCSYRLESSCKEAHTATPWYPEG